VTSRPACRRLTVPLLASAIAVLALFGIALGRGSLGDVIDLFRNARYAEARAALAGSAHAGADPAEVRLWEQRLATAPDRAQTLALAQVRDRDLPTHLRVQAGLDAASLAIARRRTEDAWQLLQPLLELPADALPGEVFLLAGQTLRLAGDRQRAREMLASVRPEDPAFAAARGLLARIGLESGDHELALRYVESAARRGDPGLEAEVLAGRWQALRRLGRTLEARAVAEQLLRDHPSSLAALEVASERRRDLEEAAAPAESTRIAAPESPAPPVGRYAVQLAAFRDRALALQFVARWQAEVADLRVVREVDQLDQPFYKVQTGSFVTAEQARVEASRLARAHGLEGFVTGSDD